MKKIISILMVVITLVSGFSLSASAANLSSCKWNTNYMYVTEKGTAYGTNTFTIYGELGQKKVRIKNSTAGSLLKVKDCEDDVYDVAKFSVKIYKSSKLVKSYTVKLGGTFILPSGWGTKYTVKIKYIPPTNMTYMYKKCCASNAWYLTYKLVEL